MPRLILFLVSGIILLTPSSRANINEIILSECFRDISDNFMFRLFNDGHKFIANKNSNSFVEIKPSGKDSITYTLTNFNSKYAEGNRIENAENKNQTMHFTNVKLYYDTKKVEIKYKTTYLENGKKVSKEGETYNYHCSSNKN
jgi:hypothetical protein